MNNLTQTPYLIIFNIIFIFGLYLFTRPALKGMIFSRNKILTIYILCVIFCVFSFWGADWFGYLAYYVWLTDGNDPSNVPMEGIYVWLMSAVDNYLFFRLVVWGSAVLLFAKTLKNLQINRSLALFFFCSIYLIFFSYARATLAIAMMFYGYSFLWKVSGRFKIKDIIWGGIWIATSFFFHKSAILGITSIIAATLILRFGERIIIMILFFSPVLIIFVNIFFQNYFSLLLSEEGTLSNYALSSTYYLEQKQGNLGISTIISWILERSPYYILAFISYEELLRPTYNHSKAIKAFLAIEFLTVVFASVFLFDFGVNTSTIYGRFIRYAQIPSVVILAHFVRYSIRYKYTKLAYKLGIVGTAYTLLYSLYDSLTVI